MKLFNIFKKETSKEVKNNIQKMDKKQLEKVIGGVDEADNKAITFASGLTTKVGSK